MLTPEENDLLVRTGTGTPMGNLLRRFWMPALLSEELPVPDCAPVRLGLVGEDLVAFRDTEGRVGIVEAYCPHRRANLFWGRNEENGLRCVYHGWKFDVNGRCVDIPNLERGDNIKSTMRITAYPTIERGGLIWAYMGPPELIPEFPAAEIFNLPPSHRHIAKIVTHGNWFQFLEGDIDTSHVGFLHNRIDGVPLLPHSFIPDHFSVDRKPVWTVKSMDYGLMLAARRQPDVENYSWRVTQWLMPFTSMIAAQKDSAFITNIRVPIDDERTMNLRMFARADQPLTANDLAIVNGGVMFPDMIPGTFTTKANIENDYLIDREEQKTKSYTGISSVPVQDLAVTQLQGGQWIADRSRERLTESDMAIVAVRRRMLKAVRALMNNEEPPEAAKAEAYRVRSIDLLAPKDMGLLDAIRFTLPDYPAMVGNGKQLTEEVS